MATALVVTKPFGNYTKGARITDPETVAQLLVTQKHRVVKIMVPDTQIASTSAKT